MYRLRELWTRIVGFRDRSRRESDLDREIAAHLQMSIDERVQQGMSADHARRIALRELGGVIQTKEAFRRQQHLPVLDAVIRDVHYAWRLTCARPAFAAAVILICALGIGVNAAVFTVAYNVVWRPLPFDEPERIVRLYQTKAQDMQMPASPLNFLDWAQLLSSTEAVAAWRSWSFDVAGADGPEPTPGALVTASLFRVLNVQPALGRSFSEQEDTPSGPPVAVISDRMWRTRFGGNPDVIGRPLTAGQTVYTVIGVLPAGVTFPGPETAIWTPLRIGDASHRMRRTENYLNVTARLGRGITLRQLQDEADRVALQLAADHPASNAGVGIAARSLHDVVTGSARVPLQLLIGVAATVLLISCANVAHLLMSRTIAREGELALRAALGATRGRLLRQSFTESMLLTLGGGVLGVLAAAATVELLRPILPPTLPRRQEIGINVAVVAYVISCAALVWIVAGTAPALRSWRVRLDERLKQSRQTSSHRFSTVGRSAVVVQVTLSIALLVAALLMVRSLRNVLAVDSGFVSQNIVVTSVSVPRSTTPGSDAGRTVVEYFDTVLQEVRRLPGVQQAGMVNHVPLGGDSSGTRFTIEHRATRPEDVHMASYRVVSPSYFSAIGARLVRGRHFDESDGPNSPPVFVINETMAKRYWPQQDPVGARMRRGGIDSKMPYTSIVGVVADMKQDALEREAKPEIFIPHAQFPWPVMNLVVRSSQPLDRLTPELRALLTRHSGEPRTQAIRTFDEVIWGTVSTRAFTVTLLLLTSLATIVAMLGIHAVAAHATAAQTKELAIRAALGASRTAILDAAVGQTLRLVFVGVTLGIVIAYSAARAVAGTLFGIAPFDPLTYGIAAMTLATIAAVASAVPARRALSLDPITALRAE